MTNRFQSFVDVVLRFRWTIALLLGGLTLAGAASTALNIRINNSVSIWFLEDNVDYQSYLSFQQERGSDDPFPNYTRCNRRRQHLRLRCHVLVSRRPSLKGARPETSRIVVWELGYLLPP